MVTRGKSPSGVGDLGVVSEPLTHGVVTVSHNPLLAPLSCAERGLSSRPDLRGQRAEAVGK